MKRSLSAVGALLLATTLSACVTTVSSPGSSKSRDLASISYETGPCFGACPVYRVTVTADGQGRFEGRRFTAVAGERRFAVTRAQFEDFARHLAPLRPAGGSVRYSGETCERMATDLPSAQVDWQSADGGSQSLYYYFGCDMEKRRAMAERLRSAPDRLPIAEYIRQPK